MAKVIKMKKGKRQQPRRSTITSLGDAQHQLRLKLDVVFHPSDLQISIAQTALSRFVAF